AWIRNFIGRRGRRQSGKAVLADEDGCLPGLRVRKLECVWRADLKTSGFLGDIVSLTIVDTSSRPDHSSFSQSVSQTNTRRKVIQVILAGTVASVPRSYPVEVSDVWPHTGISETAHPRVSFRCTRVGGSPEELPSETQ